MIFRREKRGLKRNGKWDLNWFMECCADMRKSGMYESIRIRLICRSSNSFWGFFKIHGKEGSPSKYLLFLTATGGSEGKTGMIILIDELCGILVNALAMDPVWRIDSGLWKSSFSCSILGVHIPVPFFWTGIPSFPSIVTNYTTKNRRLSEKNPHTLGTYPRFPFPTVYAGEFLRVWVCLGPTGFREFLRFSMAGTVVGAGMKNSEMTSSRTDIFIE